MAAIRMSEADHDAVTRAVAEAEAGTSGEIVTIVTAQCDSYVDIAWAWAGLVMLLALMIMAVWPGLLIGTLAAINDGWVQDVRPGELLAWLLVVLSAKFVGWRLIMMWRPLRLAVTPSRVKARRVRRRAIEYFRVAAERRTEGRTGIVILLSLAEHRAEIVADAAIHAVVPQEAWGEAMAALIDDVREGRPTEGLIEAVRQVGAILTQHLPAAAGGANELPDRLIEL